MFRYSEETHATIYSSKQYNTKGFMKNSSIFRRHILHLEVVNAIDAIYLDFITVFDTFHHNSLIQKSLKQIFREIIIW